MPHWKALADSVKLLDNGDFQIISGTMLRKSGL